MGISTEAPIIIGFAGPLSGASAAMGREYLQGVQMAIDDINGAGGVLNGRQIHLVSIDDHADPQQAVGVAQRLINSHAAAVIGPLTSLNVLSSLALFARYHIPILTPSSDPRVTGMGFSNVFRINSDNNVQGNALGYYTVAVLHARRVAIVVGSNQQAASDVAAGVSSAGGTVTGIVPAPSINRTLVAAIKRQRPQAVCFSGSAAQAASLVRDMRDMGMSIPFMGPDSLYGQEFIRLASAAAEGAYLTFAAPPAVTDPALIRFVGRYQARYKAKPSVAQYGYDSFTLLVWAIEKSDSIKPVDIAAALHAGTFVGVLGTYQFNAAGALLHGGSTYLYRVHNGLDIYLTSIDGIEK